MKVNNTFLRVLSVPVESTSFAASFNSDAVRLGHIYLYSIQLVYSGGATGSVKLQGSNDPTERNQTPTNWNDIAGSTVDLAVGSPITWNVTDSGYGWVRLAYTRTAGTLVLTATYSLKGW